MFSIIIPTKDEEKFIGTLLSSIRAQTLQPDEIIIADKSQDNTVKIAHQYNTVIVEGTDDHRIGKARNNGARYTDSEYLVFLDGDCELPKNDFFEKLINKFKEKDLDIATCYYSPNDKNLRNILIFTSFNALKTWGHLTKKVIAEGAACIIIKRTVFEAIDGFNEKLTVGEDLDIIKRSIENDYRFGVIPLLIKTSTRRYKGRSILAISLGAIGVAYATIYGFKWLRQHSDKFSNLYWGKEKNKKEKNKRDKARKDKKRNKKKKKRKRILKKGNKNA
jgi:glycosyltransferase involved in cell wall biosynthesis